MNGQLLKMANALTLNLHNIDDLGLIGGKMGAALFYYELSRYTDIETYNDMADHLLDDVLNNVVKLETGSIERGIAGVGWGINYLIRKSFIDASDDIFVDLEQALFSKENVSFDIHFSTLSPAIYLLSKSEENRTLGEYDRWVTELLNTCSYYFLHIYDNKKKPLDLINSMLYFLIELQKQKIHLMESSKLIWKILNYLLSDADIVHDINGDSMILLSLLEQLDDSTPLKKETLAKLNKIKYDSWSVEALKKIWWQQILFSCRVKSRITMADINQILISIDNNEVNVGELIVPLGLYLMNIYKSE